MSEVNLQEKVIKDLKTNEEINADELYLIDEDGKPLGKVSRDQALYLAFEKGYDLVLINDSQTPPIGKLMDYGKYLYSKQKQVSKQKAKAHASELKEIRFGLKIDSHDLDVKIAKAKKFLERGDKVKVTIQLRGREMMFQDRVKDLIGKVCTETGATLEKSVERMGNRFSAIMTKVK